MYIYRQPLHTETRNISTLSRQSRILYFSLIIKFRVLNWRNSNTVLHYVLFYFFKWLIFSLWINDGWYLANELTRKTLTHREHLNKLRLYLPYMCITVLASLVQGETRKYVLELVARPFLTMPNRFLNGEDWLRSDISRGGNNSAIINKTVR